MLARVFPVRKSILIEFVLWFTDIIGLIRVILTNGGIGSKSQAIESTFAPQIIDPVFVVPLLLDEIVELTWTLVDSTALKC